MLFTILWILNKLCAFLDSQKLFNALSPKPKMKKRMVFLGVIVVLALLLLGGYFIYSFKNTGANYEKACIGEKVCFNIEVADSSMKRVLGLSNRNSLGEDAGMLFIFAEEGTPGFWMKEMKFYSI